MDVDRNFKTAIEALSAYERRQHLNTKTLVAERMRAANEMDISNWKVSKRLKETFRVREEFPPLLRGSYSVILMLILSR